MTDKIKKQFKLIKERQGVSLLLTLFILTVMLTATLVSSDVILRQGKIMKKVTASERSYFAGEVGIEETLYEINKTRQKNINTELVNCWCSINCNDCQVSYSDGNAQWQVDSITEDLIDTDDPLEFTLAEGESFQLNLDMMGATYPTGNNLQFNRTSGGSGQLIVFKEDKSTGDIFQYGPDSSSSTSTDLDIANYYYKFRIRNPSGSGESIIYNVKPLGGQNLAVGATITISATYKGTDRRVEANNSKWQIYGE